jgi:hypothetical protein
LKQYKNLIAAGCSFSSDAIGGVPPTEQSMGGCSFIDARDGTPSTPKTWVGFLAQQLTVTSLVNVACSGHGNILTANSILEILNKFNYDPADTLIVFNLTDPARLDIPCAFDSLNEDDRNVLWTKDIINYSYLKISNDNIDKIKIWMGIDQVERFTSNAIELLFTLLEYRKFNYYFMIMGNYIDHQYLGPIIKKHKDRLISLNPGISMIDFCQLTNNTVSDSDLHPSIDGHKIIADMIYEYINGL